MKRYLSMLLIICMLLISGCGSSSGDTVKGQVVTCGGNPYFFEVACKNGKNYAFVISDATELIWEDKSAWSIWDESDDPWDVFSCSMDVTVTLGAPAESSDESVDECVEGWFYAEKVTVTGVDESYFAVDAKPVIYLYPEESMEVSVSLDYTGKLTCTYPEYENGWTVTAHPDGTLIDGSGMLYNYLYWEGVTSTEYDFSEGFCIPGDETAAFLEDALAKLGLSRREANEFIVYWLPLMEGNAYNQISFQTETYTSNAQLHIEPQPDTMIRVFMAWKPLSEPVDLPAQELSAPDRVGFTVVEWGGAMVEN